MNHSFATPGSLIVFGDDWGRHPSSIQHIVKHLAAQTPILWVNTIGMRPPRLNWPTVNRVGSKFRQWFLPKRNTQRSDNPQVVSPYMWPWLRSRFDRSINKRLLVRQLHKHIARLPLPIVAITTIPIVADLIGQLPVDRWVYYCVDDFSVWPGLDGRTLRRLEEEMLPRVQSVIAASEVLRTRVAAWHPHAALLTHGVDVPFWSQSDLSPPALLSTLTRPLTLFWGVVDQRMDGEFIGALSSLTRGTILLLGPHDNPDPRILNLPNVVAPGPIPFEYLPAFAAQADVLVMPYRDIPVPRAMQPLKFKEYLATGKQIVARRLPAVEEWADAAYLVDTADEFSQRVLHSINEPVPPSQLADRLRLDSESWQTKSQQFLQMLVSTLHPVNG